VAGGRKQGYLGCLLVTAGSQVDAGQGNVAVPDLLAEVNARVRELAESQCGDAASWDFRCECGDPKCDQAVLTVAEYEVLRASSRPILADGHEPCRVRVAREASRELQDESRALREQARLQAQRTRRNLDPTARRLQLVCGSCGYGISVERPPDRCPMCSAWDWRRAKHCQPHQPG
jgi:rubrerythrin